MQVDGEQLGVFADASSDEAEVQLLAAYKLTQDLQVSGMQAPTMLAQHL